MRILLLTRPDHGTRAGGDAVVIDTLRELLEQRGHRVLVAADAAAAAHVDVVHLFNVDLLPQSFANALTVIGLQRPYVITPLYWPLHEAVPWQAHIGLKRHVVRWMPAPMVDRLALARSQRRWASLALPARYRRCTRHELRRFVLTHAAAILATGAAEQRQLLADFPSVSPSAVHIIRLGYRPAADEPPDQPVPPSGYVLCVGALGPRKNQLGLARALSGLKGARLVCIGQTAHGCEDYARQVRRTAPPDSVFLPDQARGSLPAFYRQAAVVAQPSFIELPGLVAMEAVAHHRPVVIADRPPVLEYLGHLAAAANPVDPDSIRDACSNAVAASDDAIATFVRAHAWETTAAAVDAVYREVVLTGSQ